MTRPQVDDLLADMAAEAVDGAIGIPGDAGIKFERMAADGVAKSCSSQRRRWRRLGSARGTEGRRSRFSGGRSES